MKKFFFYFILCNTFLFSQNSDKILLSGSLINDTKIVNQKLLIDQNLNSSTNSKSRKTPILAGLISFAIPGAGQFYSESYLKAGIFAAVEVSAIVFAVIYNGKGNDQTEFFENYANQNWSAYRYANWTIHNASTINPDVDPNNYNVIDQNNNVNWNELNRLEGDIGNYYSHRLAPFGDQQYYEMIGKYSQFNVGWVQFGDDPTKSYVYGDPLVEQFDYYSTERGKANDFYTISKWAVVAVVSNHFISALDAAWTANSYNKKFNLNVSVKEEQIGFYKEYFPQLNIQYNF
ncbi:MAG: hypothetical protein IPM32_10465 [Ignavibacteriae bacterium]|nr:hypothetical protein [Ignavibacteriota bacterium]